MQINDCGIKNKMYCNNLFTNSYLTSELTRIVFYIIFYWLYFIKIYTTLDRAQRLIKKHLIKIYIF